MSSAFARWVNSPTGPKTTHFWGPVANWGFVAAVRGVFHRRLRVMSRVFYTFFSRYLFCLSPPSGRSSLFICDRHPVVSCNPHHSRTHRTLIINRVWWTRKNQKSLSPDRWLGPYASTPLYSCDLLGEWNRETIYSSPAMRRTNACKCTIFNDGPGGAWIIQRTAVTTLALLILEMSFLNWRRRSNYKFTPFSENVYIFRASAEGTSRGIFPSEYVRAVRFTTASNDRF